MFFTSAVLLAFIAGSNAYIQLVVRTPAGQPKSELEGWVLGTVPINSDHFLPDMSDCDPAFMLFRDAQPGVNNSPQFWAATWTHFHNPGASQGVCNSFPCKSLTSKDGKKSKAPPPADPNKDWTLFNMGRWETVKRKVNPSRTNYFLGKMPFFAYAGEFDYDHLPGGLRKGYMQYSTCRPKDFLPGKLTKFILKWQDKLQHYFRYITMYDIDKMTKKTKESPYSDHQYPIYFGSIGDFGKGEQTQFALCWSRRQYSRLNDKDREHIPESVGQLSVYLHGLASEKMGLDYLSTVYRRCEKIHLDAKAVFPEVTDLGNYGSVMSAVYDRHEMKQKNRAHQAAIPKPVEPDVDDQDYNERYMKLSDLDISGVDKSSSSDDSEENLFKMKDEDKEKNPWDEVNWEELAKQKDMGFGPKPNI